MVSEVKILPSSHAVRNISPSILNCNTSGSAVPFSHCRLILFADVAEHLWLPLPRPPVRSVLQKRLLLFASLSQSREPRILISQFPPSRRR